MTLDWLRTARPLFTTLGPNVPWTQGSVEDRVARAVEDGHDTLMAFVQDEGYALWPSRSAPHAPRAAGADLVRWWVDAAHAADLRFVAQWMGVHVQTVQAARHPAWLQRDATGAPAAAMCLNSPFGDVLAAQIGEVVADYPVDAIYLDGAYARQGGCFCDGCRGRFEAWAGRPLERSTRWTPGASRAGEHWLDFGAAAGDEDATLAAFRFATVTGFLARVAQVVRSTRPGTAIILDTLGAGGAFWANAHDLSALSASVDAFALECYPDQLHEALWVPSFETALLAAVGERPIWMLRWVARDPDGDLVPVPRATLEVQLATAAIHAARPTIVDMNLASIDRSLAPVIGRANEAAARLDAWRRDAEPVRWAGIVTLGALREAGAGAGQVRRHADPLTGAWLALTEAHLPVAVVADAQLAADPPPAGLEVLVLPDTGALPTKLAERIARWVTEDGLGLVATYRSLLQAAGPLRDVLGVRSSGFGYRAGRIGTEAIGGGELVTYLSLEPTHPIALAAGTRWSSFAGGFLRLTSPSSSEGQVIGWLHDADHAAMDGERWFGWYPGVTTAPLGIARHAGAGRVVTWAAPLDTLFFRDGRAEHGALLASAAAWAARRAPVVQVEAPITVETSAWRGPEGVIVVAANRTTDALYAIGPGVAIGPAASSSAGGAGGGSSTMRAAHPRVVVPVDVSICTVGSGRVAERLSGGTVSGSTDGGCTRFEMPRVAALDAIRLRPSS